MANLSVMINWISVILSEQLDQIQISTLLNKADLEETEGWSWNRSKRRATINSFPATTFTVNVQQNATQVVSTSGNFPIIPQDGFAIRLSGQTYAPMEVVPNQSSSPTLTLATPYPGATATGASGILFQLRYSVPGFQEVTGVQQQVKLRYMTQVDLDRIDPWLSQMASPALNWIPWGRQPITDDARIVLWPIETGQNGYVVTGLSGHSDMVNPTDLPSVPSAVISAKATAEACETLYTLRGDEQWGQMRDYYRNIYREELANARERDRMMYGVLGQVRDARAGIAPGLDTVPYRDSPEWD